MFLFVRAVGFIRCWPKYQHITLVCEVLRFLPTTNFARITNSARWHVAWSRTRNTVLWRVVKRAWN